MNSYHDVIKFASSVQKNPRPKPSVGCHGSLNTREVIKAAAPKARLLEHENPTVEEERQSLCRTNDNIGYFPICKI